MTERPAGEQRPDDDAPAADRPERGRTRSAAEAARLARVFGETLPQTSSDERSSDGERPSSPDDWLRSQVPPHHG
ncbi:hypothetical protein [Nocardia nova]|uniref:Uncharacterized protein n=1 Tax=Nocardia nova SH22a TaxID=1415166 RepID=W5TQL6_9NOCA|nr:hypothetical protein [Nocardia nova]AHH21542.1 hypothetical protein NONO_c67750 [Nocardia nova SH22a]